jgi:hypothetical protein
MDVLDQTDGYFFHQHFPDDRRYAGLGTGVADHRTARFSDDPDNAGDEIFFGVAGQCLYPSGVARIDKFGVVDCDDHIFVLGNYRYALGVKVIEDFRLKIEYLRSASSGSICGD